MKRREVKSKGEKERYTLLNAEFQRTAKRDEKTILSDQCKEIEEKHRMGKTRDLFKKIRDTKGTFLTKMGTMKGRNCMYLTEEIKKRWQEYTEELHKKDLHDQDNHDSVVTHLKPDIGEGSGTPLQYSCLENPLDGGAWWAAIYGVAQNWTRLKRLSSSSSSRGARHPGM